MHSSAADDVSLLALVQKGEEAAMASLFDRYASIVYSIALRILRDPMAAEDVLQEIFMQVWRNPEGFLANRGSMAAWLAVIARNRSIDILRRRKPNDSVEDVILHSKTNIAEEVERDALIAKAQSIIHSLPTDQRKTLEMAFFDGLTHTEIAEMTGDPLGTVKTRIRAGLMSLRKAMLI